jgi:phosphoribosylformimino-5-aminoimidazole carboxamide ribotide isomerase
MIIIPAIDIRQGNLVMLKQGKIEGETVYSKDPVFMAKIWQAKGAERLHIVDLDGAFSGNSQNIEAIKKIRQTITVPIQLGGGIRTLKAVDSIMDIGIEYAILGTVAVYNPDVLRQAVEKYPGRIIVAVDIIDGKVAIAGWKETTSVDALDLLGKIKDMGVEEILSTDIKKDGMMQGPNVTALAEIAKKGKMRVIASGGITTLKDIEALKNYESDGITAAIIGKALYTEDIKLEDAIKTGKK